MLSFWNPTTKLRGVERGVQKRGVGEKRCTNVGPTSYRPCINVFITFFKLHQSVFPERCFVQTTNKLHLRDAQTSEKIIFCISSDGATFPQALPSLHRASGAPVFQTKMLKVPESGKQNKNRKTTKRTTKKPQKNNKKTTKGNKKRQ